MPADETGKNHAWEEPSVKEINRPNKKERAMNPSHMEQKTDTKGWRCIFIIICEPYPSGLIVPVMRGRKELR